jgi:hypothetical protein
MKIVKKFLIGLLFLLAAIQFIRPAKNQSTEITANHIYNVYATSDDVKNILDKACNDCHSNNTKYPWYASIQPATWWLNDHIKDGKRHLNFSQFGSYSISRQYKKLEESIDEIKEGEMPLNSYTWIHTNAKLSDAEKEKLFTWFNAIRDTLKAKYPADSLVKKK